MNDDIKIYFNTEQQLAICRPHGVLAEKHTEQLLNFLVPLEESNPKPFNRLLDLTLVKDVELNSAAIHGYAAARLGSTEHLAPFRTAILVRDSHAAAEPTAVLYAILMKDTKIQVRVFDNAKSAADWLGVPEEALHSEFAHTK